MEDDRVRDIDPYILETLVNHTSLGTLLTGRGVKESPQLPRVHITGELSQLLWSC